MLLVEDDPEIAASVRDGLQRHGYTVDVVDRGWPAIEMGPAVDVILLDLGLPDIDGDPGWIETVRGVGFRVAEVD